MASLRPADLAGFLKTGCRTTPLILIFGSDEGLVRARIRAVTEALLGQNADSLSVLDLDAEQLSGDPARLLDEANAISMFGGKRVIIVRQANRLHKSAWSPLFEVPPIDSTILFQADELTKSAALRLAAEQSSQAMAIACYPPSTADLGEMLDARIRAAGLTITPVARAALLEYLGSDYALSEREIEKIILYCHGQLAIEPADIEACMSDSSSSAMSEAIDLAFDGRMDAVESAALQSFREGINPSALISIAINHVLLLRRLKSARDSGGIDLALRQEGIFFRRLDRIKRQLGLWDDSKLSRAVSLLALAQEQGRLNAPLEDVITIRALWAIGLAARRK